MPIVDYAPSPTDNDVLKLPIKQELKPEQMTQVFGFPRDLRRRCVKQCASLVTGGSAPNFASCIC